MPLAVGRYPLGLLPLLDSKQQGQAPRLLADEYAGVIDVGELMALQLRDRLTGTAVAPVLGTTLFLTVPTNEIWRIDQASMSLSATGAATVFTAGLAMANSAGGTTSISPQDAYPTTGAGLFQVGALNRPLWLKPGEQLGVVVTRTDANVSLVNVTAHVSRFAA
jgi:hypothetical protein